MRNRILKGVGAIMLSAALAFGSVSAPVLTPTAAVVEAKTKTIKQKLTVNVGATKTVKVDGTIKSVKNGNKKVTSVSKNAITGLSKGSSLVTIKTSKAVYKITVTVPKASFKKTKATLTVGKKTTIKGNKVALKGLKWKSSNNNVATVKDGVVTAISAGTAKITGTIGGTTLTFTVTVNKPSNSGNNGGNNGSNNGGNNGGDNGGTNTSSENSTWFSLTYSDSYRPAYKGKTRITEKLNAVNITFKGNLPKTVNDLKKIDRSNGKGTEDDGKQDGKYVTVACFMAALAAYSEGRKSDGKAMMDYLLKSPSVPNPTSGDLSYYFEYGQGEKNPWAFFDGSTPANKYTPDKPYSLSFEEFPYAPESFPTYGITYEKLQFYTDNHPCLKNNSTVAVYRDPIDGQWYLHPDKGYWSFALSTASMN